MASASSMSYSLTTEEEKSLRKKGEGEDIRFINRNIDRTVKKRQSNWTRAKGNECHGAGDMTVLMFGMGGVGKSALGNLLLDYNGFGTSNKAMAETNKVTGLTCELKEDKLTVWDTPGYLMRQVLQGEALPEEAIKEGVRKIRKGVHALILVFNGGSMRHLQKEIKIIKKANLLNERTFKHCILVVTHGDTNYNGKTVDDFIADASVAPEFQELIRNIKSRVVLVELGSEGQIGQGKPYHAMQLGVRQMVIDMVRKTMNNNAERGTLYRTKSLRKDQYDETLYLTANIEQDFAVAFAECFPPKATVTTPLGKKTMEELELNDEVLVVNSQGQLLYEKVIMFSHANPSHRAYFRTLSTEDGKVLQLSPGHLLHVGHIGNLTAAQDVNVGDVVFTVEAVEGVGVKRVLVTTLSGEWLTGIYCPHTACGSIIVDGVAASCYTNLLSPTLAHAAMLPVRVAHYLLPDDWFRWMLPYNQEQGMPSLALNISKMMRWS